MNPLYLPSKINRTIFHGEKKYLFFSGTAYLGMGGVEKFENAVIQGIQKYGLNHGLSRINNVRLQVYDHFERFFAEQAEADKALVYSSGYLAGYAAVTHFKKEADHIFVAPDTHPAVLPDELVPDPLQTFGNWADECLKLCSSLPSQKILFLANAVDPLKPVIHSFDWMKALPGKHEYTLLVDESHAFGVLGKGVFGTYGQWKNPSVNLVVSGSLGKAVGIPAGIILGSQKSLQPLEQHKIFRSSSPPAPGYLEAFLICQHLYQTQIEKLKQNLGYFSGLIEDLELLNGDERYPVFTFQDTIPINILEEKGIIISSFSYPTAKDPAVNRIIVSAHHEKADLWELAKLLKKMGKPD